MRSSLLESAESERPMSIKGGGVLGLIYRRTLGGRKPIFVLVSFQKNWREREKPENGNCSSPPTRLRLQILAPKLSSELKKILVLFLPKKVSRSCEFDGVLKA